MCPKDDNELNRAVSFLTTPVTVIRTGAEFRSQSDPEHHKRTSPLVNMSPVVYAPVEHQKIDPFHTCYKEVFPRIIRIFRDTKLTRIDAKTGKQLKLRPVLPTVKWEGMSRVYSGMKFPRDFSRKSRNLKLFDQFKATEMRMMALYGLEFLVIYTEDVPEELQTAVKCLCCAT